MKYVSKALMGVCIFVITTFFSACGSQSFVKGDSFVNALTKDYRFVVEHDSPSGEFEEIINIRKNNLYLERVTFSEGECSLTIVPYEWTIKYNNDVTGIVMLKGENSSKFEDAELLIIETLGNEIVGLSQKLADGKIGTGRKLTPLSEVSMSEVFDVDLEKLAIADITKFGSVSSAFGNAEEGVNHCGKDYPEYTVHYRHSVHQSIIDKNSYNFNVYVHFGKQNSFTSFYEAMTGKDEYKFAEEGIDMLVQELKKIGYNDPKTNNDVIEIGRWNGNDYEISSEYDGTEFVLKTSAKG